MTNDLLRKENESFFEWKVRLITLKIDKEIDLDWIEIRDLLELDCSPDHLRKTAYGLYEYNKFVEQQKIVQSPSEFISELEEKKRELEKVKVQVQDQRREYKKYLRHEGRIDNLLRELLDSIKDDINTKKPLHWYKKPTGIHIVNKAIALLLSDIHKGLHADNHWNKYNTQVFYERLNLVVNETLEYKRIHNVNELHIFQLGDVIHGVIHRLSRLGDTEDAVKATQMVAEAFAEMIAKFANEFDKVVFYSVKGNHDRTQSRKEEEIRTESFHEFIPWYMKARLEHFENVIFQKNEIDDEIIIADILGHTYFGVHGHLEGLGKVITDLTMMTRKFPTAVFSAHIHKNFENEIHQVDLIVNGGFAGTDDYAKDKRLISKPHQKLLLLDGKGRSDTHYIRFN
jgi:hypothetical protein